MWQGWLRFVVICTTATVAVLVQASEGYAAPAVESPLTAHVNIAPWDTRPSERERVMRATIARLRRNLKACQRSLSTHRRNFERSTQRRKEHQTAAVHQNTPIDQARIIVAHE